MRAEAIAALFLVAATLGGCRSSFEAVAPHGFAAFDGEAPFRAVSPDGVVYRVRSESTRVEDAELKFWAEALKRRMTSAGYNLLSEDDIDANGQKGHLLELTAPRGPEDHLYLVAIFAREGDVVVVEAAGEIHRFTDRKDDVLDAIRALVIRK